MHPRSLPACPNRDASDAGSAAPTAGAVRRRTDVGGDIDGPAGERHINVIGQGRKERFVSIEAPLEAVLNRYLAPISRPPAPPRSTGLHPGRKHRERVATRDGPEDPPYARRPRHLLADLAGRQIEVAPVPGADEARRRLPCLF